MKFHVTSHTLEPATTTTTTTTTAPAVPLQSVCAHHTVRHHHTATVCLPTVLELRQGDSKLEQFFMLAVFYLINKMAPASA